MEVARSILYEKANGVMYKLFQVMSSWVIHYLNAFSQFKKTILELKSFRTVSTTRFNKTFLIKCLH